MQPMEIRLLYFGGLKERVAAADTALTLPFEELTVGAFLEWLVGEQPPLRGALGGVRVAVNEAFASDAAVIRPGDVVALIPPVTGG